MDDEIQLISDGQGLAVIGEPMAVDRFLSAQGLESRELGLPRLANILSASSGAADAASLVASNSGRWVQLTTDSAAKIDQFGLMKGSGPGLSRGVVTSNGKIQSLVEFTKGPGALLANPAVLAGAAGVMAQVAMQQTMDEILDYLAVIDEKVDDILRAQKDAVLADIVGVGAVIQEAMTIRDHVGRVSEVSWSKLLSTSMTIARTQAYALRQLDALADKVERQTKLGELAKTSKQAETKVMEWLAVLARCFQLQDAIAILELDRVLDASPGELDSYRLGLRASRQERLELISRSTAHLLARMDLAASRANSKALLHPQSARAVVLSSNNVGSAVIDFQGLLGIERDRQALEARRWVDAASEMRDKVLETGSDGIDSAKRLGNETLVRTKSVSGKAVETGSGSLDAARRLGSENLGRAKSVSGRFSSGLAERTRGRRAENGKRGEEGDDEG
jgi:hypothetical protein